MARGRPPKTKGVEIVNYDNLPRAELIAELRARDNSAEYLVNGMLEKERQELKDALDFLVTHTRNAITINGHEALGAYYVALGKCKRLRGLFPSYEKFGFSVSYHAEKLREALVEAK